MKKKIMIAVLVIGQMLFASASISKYQHFIMESESLIKLPTYSYDGSEPYVYTIDRQHVDGRLLALAESVYPPRKDMLEKYPNVPEEMMSDSLWYFQGSGEILVPFTITASSVKHYLDLLKRYEASDSALEHLPKKAKFIYKVDSVGPTTYIFEGEMYEKVTLIIMYMEWSTYTSGLSAGGFSGWKIVIFDSKNNVLGVIGDGFKGVWAS